MAETTVLCDCGSPMVARLNRITNSLFYGCLRYPECTKTRSVQGAVEMRRAGGIELPGLEDL
jgi:ssDNA-binding Zn-finger/Zn-ribbon topoisomerase 1